METGVHYPLRLDALPTGWRAGYVGDFAKEIEPGFASGEHNQTGDGVAHLRPMNIDREGKIDLLVTKFVSTNKDRRRLAVGDVLFNNTNSPELVGKTAAVSVAGDFAFSNHMTRIRFADNVLPKFGALQLHFLWMRGDFKYNCVKHVNQASVSSRALARGVPFVWAPPPEQERIVAELEKQFSRLDEAVANLKRVKGKLRRHQVALLRTALEGNLVATESELNAQEGRRADSRGGLVRRVMDAHLQAWRGKGRYVTPEHSVPGDLPELPNGWAWIRFGLLGRDPHNTVQTGPFGAQLDNTEFKPAGVPVIAVGNLTGTGFTAEGTYFVDEGKAAQLSRYDVWAGDLLFARSGATLGKVCVAPEYVEDWRMTGHILRARLNTDFLLPQIAVFALRFQQFANKSSVASAV